MTINWLNTGGDLMTLKLAMRYLRGRKLRTVLTTISIVFGVMIIFGLNGLIPALNAAFDESMNESVHQVDILLTHELGWYLMMTN